MSENNELMNLPIINVGIVGHIDHGKTTLLQKLSGKWASTHSEELKRGITIKLGYADIVIYDDKGNFNIEKKGKPVRRVSFIDAPGHEMLMATMLSGAALIDAAVLVIAANEGIKPQTREHLMALQAKKVSQLLVVQSKIDLVTQEIALKNYEEIKKLLKGKFDDVPIIPVSSQQGINIDVLLKNLAELKVPERKLDAKPIFIVARSFDINRPGTKPEDLKGCVLGGILKSGTLRAGDEIVLKPGRAIKENERVRFEELKTTIKGLFLGSNSVEQLTPGGSASIQTSLDMALGKGDALAGNIVSVKGVLPELASVVNLKSKLFKETFGPSGVIVVQPINVGETIMLSINTSTTGGVVQKVQGETLRVALKLPIVPQAGENVGIARNIGGHWRLIGSGELA